MKTAVKVSGTAITFADMLEGVKDQGTWKMRKCLKTGLATGSFTDCCMIFPMSSAEKKALADVVAGLAAEEQERIEAALPFPIQELVDAKPGARLQLADDQERLEPGIVRMVAEGGKLVLLGRKRYLFFARRWKGCTFHAVEGKGFVVVCRPGFEAGKTAGVLMSCK